MLKIIKNKRIWVITVIFLLFFSFAANPSLNIHYKTLINDIFRFPLSITSLLLQELKAVILYRVNSNENLRLKKEISSLKEKLLKSQEAMEENALLNKLLSLKTESGFSAVIASVIGRDASNWSNSLIIDKGYQSKIKVGMAVISSDGLVGRTQEVGANTTRVILISDPNLNVAALLERSRQSGVVSGTLSDKLIMRYLDKNSDIRVGDLVLTSSVSSIYPKAIPIGRVSSVATEAGGLSVFALVQPAVRLTSIEEVMVIL